MTKRLTGRPAEILLVEDNPGDVKLTERALKDGRILTQLHVAENGEEALAFLRREGEHADAPRPDLILLDLNLPRKDGREVLAEIKADESLKRIPVVILTTSRSEKDIDRTYDLHANSYIIKPVDLKQFVEVIKLCGNYWLALVELPSGEGE